MSQTQELLHALQTSTDRAASQVLVDKALGLTDLYHKEWVEFGEAANAHGLKSAAEFYKKAVDADPKDTASWAKLGLLAKAAGQKEEAIKYLTKAIELDERVEFLQHRAALYLETGHDQLAKEDTEVVICQEAAQKTLPQYVANDWAKNEYH